MPSMNTCRRRQASSTCSRRVYSSASTMMMKKKITNSKLSVDDVRKVRAPTTAVEQHQYTTVTTKRKRDDDMSSTFQPPPPPPPIAAAAAAADQTRRKQLVQVERLGGLKLRFRFSWIDHIHSSSNSSGDHITAPPLPVTTTVVKTTNKLAVQEIIRSTDDVDEERNRRTLSSWRQMKLQRERESARRKMESMAKTVDIPNNYSDTMLQLHRMFGPTQWVREAFCGVPDPKPLHKLGLFLKL